MLVKELGLLSGLLSSSVKNLFILLRINKTFACECVGAVRGSPVPERNIELIDIYNHLEQHPDLLNIGSLK